MGRICIALVFGLSVAACGGSDGEVASTDTVPSPTTEFSETDDQDSAEPTAEAPIADACALLDEAFLDQALAGVESTFGGPLDFQEPLQESPSAFCSWKDASNGLSIQLTIEPTATAETDDHSGRSYNIDVEPVVEPQDGPGTKAVLLIDTAFSDLLDDDGLAYGYFFVEGEVTAFVETVGLDMGAENLRVLAEEVDARLLAG